VIRVSVPLFVLVIVLLGACAPARPVSPLVQPPSLDWRDHPSHIMDGYQHWLRVNRSSPVVYIIQAGGILGTRTVFGPFLAERGCVAA
jgi:hypothetical protein